MGSIRQHFVQNIGRCKLYWKASLRAVREKVTAAPIKRFDIGKFESEELPRLNRINRGFPIVIGLQATIFASLLAHNEAEPTEAKRDAATVDVQVSFDPNNLSALDNGEVVSNSHTARWRVFTDNGRDLFSQGRIDEAEKFLIMAVDEAKQGFGPSDPHVASACNNLAEFYRMTKAYSRAEPLYLEAIELLKSSYSPNHHSVGVALHNLGGFYLLQHNLQKAHTCYEESLKVKGASLGPQHPEYASGLFHLGEVMRLEGRLSEAKAVIKDSIRVLEDCGSGHSAAAMKRMGRLAEILCACGDWEDAEQLQRKLLHAVEVTQGNDSLAAAMANDTLANTLKERGKLEEAWQRMHSALLLRSKLLPKGHGLVGVTLSKLGQLRIMRASKAVAGSRQQEARKELEGAMDELKQAEQILGQQWMAVCGDAPKPSSLFWGWGQEATPKIIVPAMAAAKLVALVQAQGYLAEAILSNCRLTHGKQCESAGCMDEAEQYLRKAVMAMTKPSVSREVTSRREVVVEHAKVLRQLASLLSGKPPTEGSAAQVDELRLRAGELDSMLLPEGGKQKSLSQQPLP